MPVSHRRPDWHFSGFGRHGAHIIVDILHGNKNVTRWLLDLLQGELWAAGEAGAHADDALKPYSQYASSQASRAVSRQLHEVTSAYCLMQHLPMSLPLAYRVRMAGTPRGA
jgi:hypothetical protein